MKVVGSAATCVVSTLVTVSVVSVVCVSVLDFNLVCVRVVVSAGTKSVDSVTEVITDETAIVVKSVTTVGISKVGMSPLTSRGLRVEVSKFSAEVREATAAVMFEGAERLILEAPDTAIELIKALTSMEPAELELEEDAETLLRESSTAHKLTIENNIGYIGASFRCFAKDEEKAERPSGEAYKDETR